MSKSQKYIKIVSIISIIAGIVSALICIIGALGVGVATSSPELASDLNSIEGYTPEVGSSIVSGLIGSAIGGLFNIIVGIFGLRAAKDANKVGPLYVWSLVSLVLNVVGLIATAATGNLEAASVLSLIFPILLFICARNVKKQRDAQ